MPYVKYKSQEGSKPVFKLGIDIFLRMLAAGFMCAIVFVSMNSIFLAFGSEVTGYTLQTIQEDGTFKTTEMVVFEGEDKTLPEIDSETMRLIPTEEMSQSAKKTCNIISQIIMLALFCVLIYTEIWSCGDNDRNLVKFEKISVNKFKGAVAAAIACVPYGLCWVAVSLSNLNILPFKFNSTFSFANIAFKPYIDLLLEKFNWYDCLLLLVPVAFIVLYCQIVYTIGYKQILISEKILYTEK